MPIDNFIVIFNPHKNWKGIQSKTENYFYKDILVYFLTLIPQKSLKLLGIAIIYNFQT